LREPERPRATQSDEPSASREPIAKISEATRATRSALEEFRPQGEPERQRTPQSDEPSATAEDSPTNGEL